jgi:hypothetical protein
VARTLLEWHEQFVSQLSEGHSLSGYRDRRVGLHETIERRGRLKGQQGEISTRRHVRKRTPAGCKVCSRRPGECNRRVGCCATELRAPCSGDSRRRPKRASTWARGQSVQSPDDAPESQVTQHGLICAGYARPDDGRGDSADLTAGPHPSSHRFPEKITQRRHTP